MTSYFSVRLILQAWLYEGFNKRKLIDRLTYAFFREKNANIIK